MMRFLWLTLCNRGFGETQLALTIARDLESRGHEAVFLSAYSSKVLMESYGVEHTLISPHVGAALELYIDQVFRAKRVDAIALGDYSTASMWFTNSCLDPQFLTSYGVPLLGIDTWNMDLTGGTIDTYWKKTREVADWREILDIVLTPTPLGPLTLSSRSFAALPAVETGSVKRSKQLRDKLGISHRDKIVLFCTAGWQQARYPCDHAERIAKLYPELIMEFIYRLRGDVHLVHVGPKPFESRAGVNYRWLKQLQHVEFDALLAASDLLLGANVSSNTIGKAMKLDIPSLSLVNPHEIKTVDDAHRFYNTAPDYLAQWFGRAVPVYPFVLWPIGFHDYLAPLADKSEYFKVIETVDTFDHEAVMVRLYSLLFDAASRDFVINKQRQYVAQVAELPSAASLFEKNVCAKAPAEDRGKDQARSLTVLLVSLHARSWGRAIIAQHIAEDLRREGHIVHVVTHSTTRSVFEGKGSSVFVLNDRFGPFLVEFMRGLVEKLNVGVIVYGDYLGAATFASDAGAGVMEELLDWDVPIASLDCWNHRATGFFADVIGCGQRGLAPVEDDSVYRHFRSIRNHLVPVPLAPVEETPGGFQFLPENHSDSSKVEAEQLGCPEEAIVVLLTTGRWQNEIRDESFQRISTLVAELVAGYLQKVDDRVVLLHVGASRLPICEQMGRRYLWRASVPPADFDKLLMRADLVLSFNIAASTISRAITLERPVLVVQNSVEVVDSVGLEEESALSDDVRTWLRRAMPLHRFRMWPLGYYDFLTPLLADNPFMSAIETVELLQESEFIHKCRGLLTSSAVRESLLKRQREYVQKVRMLPRPSKVIEHIVSEWR